MQNSLFLKEPSVNILEEPIKNSNLSSQLIYGEKFKIIGKKKKQAMLDAIPKSYYAYRDGLIDYGTQLLQGINDEVNSASEEDDW